MTDQPDVELSGGEGTTLTEVLDAYTSGGFATQFSVTDNARLECGACSAVSEPDAVRMSSLRRLEGASDPDDMMAVVALTCPACSAKGTVVLGFGPAASAEDGDVLRALRDHRGDHHAPGNSAPGETTGDTSAR
jgi:hypothetical protein